MKKCLKCGSRFDDSDWRCPECSYVPQANGRVLLFAPDLQVAEEGFGGVFFENLVQLEDGSFWFRTRNQLLLWAFEKYFKDKKTYLEIGCGTGYVLSAFEQAFPDLRVAGSEIHANGLKYAMQRVKHAELYQLDARKLPFEEEFDVIGAYDVLEHIVEDELTFAAMYRAVKRGGGIILSVPQHPFLWSAADDYAHHQRRYTRHDLLDKLGKAGFSLVRCTSFVSILMPAMLTSRLMCGRDAGSYDPHAELTIGKTANTLLEYVMRLENRLIRCGISFPVGGSLLAIARKV